MPPTTFHSSYGDFTLQRRPPTPHLPLQAWDAADEYLLLEAYLHRGATVSQVLVVNDQFGALAVPFSQTETCSWSDSCTAHLATLDNFARNGLDTSRLRLLPSTQAPSQRCDLLLWRLPKTLALLQQQACALQTCTDATTTILAGAMQKHLPPRTLEMLRQVGEVEPLPTRKKARLFSLQLRRNAAAASAADGAPLAIDQYGLHLYGGANVFARNNFDIGARFFVEQFAQLPRAEHIADLGCGNGVVGLRAKQLQPWAQLAFFDESYQAVDAARRNYAINGLCELKPAATFHVDDVFAGYKGESFDLILCNPPFHQGHVVGDHIARQMFRQSCQQLRAGGELWIVGNRHLDYHIKLKKLFGNCRRIAANPKFVVLAARVQHNR